MRSAWQDILAVRTPLAAQPPIIFLYLTEAPVCTPAAGQSTPRASTAARPPASRSLAISATLGRSGSQSPPSGTTHTSSSLLKTGRRGRTCSRAGACERASAYVYPHGLFHSTKKWATLGQQSGKSWRARGTSPCRPAGTRRAPRVRVVRPSSESRPGRGCWD